MLYAGEFAYANLEGIQLLDDVKLSGGSLWKPSDDGWHAGLEIDCSFAEFFDHRCSFDVSSIIVVMSCADER